MSERDRVIVAVPKNSGEIAGVFEDRDAYYSWFEQSDWNENQLNIRDCRVRE